MTGAELRRIMRVRRIKTVEAAHALGIHPQTIRNLWVKDEVPRLYLMALITYGWALGQDQTVFSEGLTPPRDLLRKEKKPGGDPGRDPLPSKKEETRANKPTSGGDLWSKLK